MCLAARDAFKSFDKKSEDRIKVGDIEAAMKRLGHNIKPDWLEKIEHMIDADGLTAFDCFQLLTLDLIHVEMQKCKCSILKRHTENFISAANYMMHVWPIGIFTFQAIKFYFRLFRLVYFICSPKLCVCLLILLGSKLIKNPDHLLI